MLISFRLLVVALFLFISGQILGQNGRGLTGQWSMYFGQNRIADRWSIHSELQWRNHTMEPNLEQLLLRGGLNFHVAPHAMVTAGYGYISTHPYDKSEFRTLSNEHRIWQQFILRNNMGRIFFEHRYRYEQRWIDEVFSQRLRYRLYFAVPINKPDIKKGSFLVAVYDEFFANVERTVFDRNRLYAALGYQLTDSLQIQGGWLAQSVPAFSKHYLQLGIFFNPDFRKTM